MPPSQPTSILRRSTRVLFAFALAAPLLAITAFPLLPLLPFLMIGVIFWGVAQAAFEPPCDSPRDALWPGTDGLGH